MDLESSRALVERIRTSLEWARKLEVAPDVDKEHPTPFDAEIPEITDIETMGRAVVYGSLGVGTRVELPLYSDDRVMRAFAREVSIPAFGTLALLDALAKRNLITSAVKDEARAELRAAGAVDLSE